MTAPTVDCSVGRPSVETAGRARRLARRPGRRRAHPLGRLTVVLPDGSRRVFGDDAASRAGRDPHPRPAGAVRMVLHGETGGGEAYMDGLWSSPDLVALLRWRRATARRWRSPPAGGASRRSSRRTWPTALRRNTRSGQPPQHRRPLRPRQRLLPAVPRRDDDLLERRLRARPTSPSPTRSATSTGASPTNAGPRAAASTSSRSARAGAASRCTRPASWAAG